MVVRGYNSDVEIAAFLSLLKSPKQPQVTTPASSTWQFELSTAYWLLIALGSGAARQIHANDNVKLRALHQKLAASASLKSLQSCNQVDVRVVQYLLGRVVACADFLCTTPHMTVTTAPCERFKTQLAQEIVVDNAGGISRPDLYIVWGNTLLPCFLAGDASERLPAPMGKKKGNHCHYHHHVADAAVSALEHLRASGMPVYRLRVQLGQVDAISGGE